MVLIMLIGLGIGIHLALFVLFGVPLAGVLYWLVPSLPAFLMAVIHPNPERRFRHQGPRITSRSGL
jgi:hypothetical protein